MTNRGYDECSDENYAGSGMFYEYENTHSRDYHTSINFFARSIHNLFFTFENQAQICVTRRMVG